MRRAGLLVIVLLAVSGSACQAGGKSGLGARMPKFIQADNGLGAAAAMRGGDFVTRVVMHFLGLDPPVEWVPPPKTADLIPAWMDELVVIEASAPGTLKSIGASSCGQSNLTHLAEQLRADAPPLVPEGLIHLDAPAASAPTFDGRAVYGLEPRDALCSG
jgi:hypothetical protein